jgi:alkylated DNA repair protein alkB family protein 6
MSESVCIATDVHQIQAAPKPRWKVLSRRRLQTWPSDLTKNNVLLESALPDWLLRPVVSRLLAIPMSRDTGNHIFSDSPHGGPNHVLINECKLRKRCLEAVPLYYKPIV